MSKQFSKTILGIGAGYVGGPTMAMIASKCPYYKILVVDKDTEKIKAWQSGKPPIFEPGLSELVNRSLNRNLFFSTDIATSIAAAEIIFVSVNTPIKDYGIGAGMAPDLRYWEQTARDIVKYSNSDKIIIEKSTVPVHTAQAMEIILHANQSNYHFDVLSNPEFLAAGSAIKDLEQPDRVLIGGHETERGQEAIKTLCDIYTHWVTRGKILSTNLWSSELSKLASNAFLAQRVSSINSIATICQHTGANITEVAHVIGCDSRIGSDFLRAGIGFGGSCFKKDILNLVYLCKHHGLDEIADYWQAVINMNDYQKSRFSTDIITHMFNTLVNKKLAILGFAFKANTGDTRDSPAIDICRYLLKEKAILSIHDPKALENAQQDLNHFTNQVCFDNNPYHAAKGTHALIILTDWNVYTTLDFQRIFDVMEKPAFLFDGRNFLDHQVLYDIGFNVYSVGKTPQMRFEQPQM